MTDPVSRMNKGADDEEKKASSVKKLEESEEEDSFLIYGNLPFSSDDDEDVDPEDRSATSSQLAEENAKLRAHLVRLQLKLQKMERSHSLTRLDEDLQQPSLSLPPSSPSKDVRSKQATPQSSLLQAAQRDSRDLWIYKLWNGKKMVKPQRSLPTDDDVATVEPSLDMDLEAHQSAPGLHHRHQYSPQRSLGLELTPRSAIDATPSKSSASSPHHHDDPSPFREQSPLVERKPASSEAVEDGVQEGPFWHMVQDRAAWLVGLLVLQSLSSFILAHHEGLIENHLVIVQFLTMLVGAGGNAGNQASVRVIRGLAVGTIQDHTVKDFLWNEFRMGLCLTGILCLAGCTRAAIFMVPLAETLAITASLFFIVWISIVLGATLPLAMKYVSIDPAHSSTTIQVLMDILGVTITCFVSQAILDSRFGAWLAHS